MQKTDEQLLTEANIIKNETETGANTATRVGNMLVDIVDSKINTDSGGGGGIPNIDQVLGEGATATDKVLQIIDQATPSYTTQMGQYGIYAYDTYLGEAEYYSTGFYAYKEIDNKDYWVFGNSSNSAPFFEVKQDTITSRIYADNLSFNNGSYNLKLYAPMFSQDYNLYLPNASGTLETKQTEISQGTTFSDIEVISNEITEIVAVGSFHLNFPDPNLHGGEKITIINTDINPVLISDNNTFAPYWNGSQSKITSIGAAQMVILVSINGKWRGGLIYD